jgi:hypothetical protein
MIENNRDHYNSANKMKMFKNINQSALNYVQAAIENAAVSSNDATQNLVNNIMGKQRM